MISKRIPLFDELEIETRSTCNRTCDGCIRNSHPDREAAAPWFEEHELPTDTILRILREAQRAGFHGTVCLQFYNEPLQDPRLPQLAALAKGMGFSYVFTCTNADYMNEALAKELDGRLDEMLVALYMGEPKKSEREAWLRTLFTKTRLTFTGGELIPTHWSPIFPTEALVRRHAANPCAEPTRRMIVNHRGDMMMCCDDLTGHFDLGNVRDHTIEELWYGERHQELVLAITKPGGRSAHPHCQSCPRP